MIALSLCRRPEALWVQISGVVTPRDLAKVRELSDVLIEAEGPAQVIVDFSQAERLDLSDEVLEEQALRPPYAADRQRVFVAREPQARERLDFYGEHQRRHGWKPPPIVDTLGEALAMVGCHQEDFRPVDTSWLDHLDDDHANV